MTSTKADQEGCSMTGGHALDALREDAEDRRDASVLALLAEVGRLRDGIRQASECDEPLMTGGTDQPTRVVGPCGTCRGCTVRQRTYALLDDRTETTDGRHEAAARSRRPRDPMP